MLALSADAALSAATVRSSSSLEHSVSSSAPSASRPPPGSGAVARTSRPAPAPCPPGGASCQPALPRWPRGRAGTWRPSRASRGRDTSEECRGHTRRPLARWPCGGWCWPRAPRCRCCRRLPRNLRQAVRNPANRGNGVGKCDAAADAEDGQLVALLLRDGCCAVHCASADELTSTTVWPPWGRARDSCYRGRRARRRGRRCVPPRSCPPSAVPGRSTSPQGLPTRPAPPAPRGPCTPPLSRPWHWSLPRSAWGRAGGRGEGRTGRHRPEHVCGGRVELRVVGGEERCRSSPL